MRRSLLASLALAVCAATASAQCVTPSSSQTLQTLFSGNTFAGAPDPVYGANLFFDLTASQTITITGFGVNLLDDGSQALPNLIGQLAEIELWARLPAPSNSLGFHNVGNGATNPATPPGWTSLGRITVPVAARGTPTGGPLTIPAVLPAGTYAIAFGHLQVITGQPNAGAPLHPIYTNATAVPPVLPVLTYADQFISLTSVGAQGVAWTAGLNTPRVGNIQLDYTIQPNSAYSTPYGVGCYDSPQSFYQSFNGAASNAGTQPPVTVAHPHLVMTPLGSPVNQYFVQGGGGSYPLRGAPGSSFYYFNDHVNAFNGAVIGGGWDDTISTAYTLPFVLNYPGGTATQIAINSNGAVFVGSNATTGNQRFFDNFVAFLGGPAAYAVGYGDLWPNDIATALGGTGDIWIDSDGASWVQVSWVNVSEFPNGTAPNDFATTGNTFQVVFNSSGIVEYAWSQLANSDTGPMLIGFTPGAGAPDPGVGLPPRSAPNLAVLPFLAGNGDRPPVLRSLNRPQVGTALVLRHTNLDPAIGALLSFISGTSLPGIDLGTLLAMPGCNANILLPEIANQLSITGFGAGAYDQNYGTIPAVVTGLNLYAQTAALCAHGAPPLPAGNPFNGPDILVTNGVCLHFDVN